MLENCQRWSIARQANAGMGVDEDLDRRLPAPDRHEQRL